MTNFNTADPFGGLLKGFFSNLGIPLPGIVTPTFDTEELGRRIEELKTVETWLKTNLGMLQATIQALELQRSSLQAMTGIANITQNGDNPFSQMLNMSWLNSAPKPEAAQAQTPKTAAETHFAPTPPTAQETTATATPPKPAKAKSPAKATRKAKPVAAKKTEGKR